MLVSHSGDGAWGSGGPGGGGGGSAPLAIPSHCGAPVANHPSLVVIVGGATRHVQGAIAAAALLVPHFGLFVNLVGAGACTALAFVLPVWFHWVLFREEVYTWWWPKAKGVAVVVFGVVGGGISLVLSVVELGTLIAGGGGGGGD